MFGVTADKELECVSPKSPPRKATLGQIQLKNKHLELQREKKNNTLHKLHSYSYITLENMYLDNFYSSLCRGINKEKIFSVDNNDNYCVLCYRFQEQQRVHRMDIIY